VYDKLGEEMERSANAGQPMMKDDVMKRTKEIFLEWMEMQLGERLKILKKQGNQRGGSRKVYLQMQRTIYGSVQAARAFWMELQKAFKAMGYMRSVADPCLYFRWDEDGELCVWLTWIDDCIIVERADISVKQDWIQNTNVCVDRRFSNKYARLQQLVDCVWGNDNKSNG
jgi:hypothetical protein